jgi:hypothetical protein
LPIDNPGQHGGEKQDKGDDYRMIGGLQKIFLSPQQHTQSKAKGDNDRTNGAVGKRRMQRMNITQLSKKIV